MKLIRLLEKTAIITVYTLQTNQVAYRACRARRDELVALYVALVVTDVARLLYSMRDTARTTFSYTETHC